MALGSKVVRLHPLLFPHTTKLSFTYLLSRCWGENGHPLSLFEEKLKASSTCEDAEEYRNDTKQVYCVI